MSKQAELQQQIAQRSATVGVSGMGYVGLPLAVRAAGQGFRVLGFEVSPEKVAQLNQGQSYIGDMPGAIVAALRASGRLEATSDAARMA